MGRVLTVLVLCLQLTSPMVGQQTAPLPPRPVERQTSNDQKPGQLPQQRDEGIDVVKITTNLLQVDAVVVDQKGKRVTDLRAEEVEMLENGREQKITNFSYVILQPKASPPQEKVAPQDRNVPIPPVRLRPEQVRRTMALVVDDLGLSFESANRVRQSLRKFIDEQMQPEDLVAIIRTGSGIGALQQFTADKRQLYAAVERIRWNPTGRASIAAFAPIGSEPKLQTFSGHTPEDINQFRQEVFTVGTLGALNYIVRGLRELPGRKSVVLFSDGLQIFESEDSYANTRILLALRRLTDLANRASVVIYTMDARGLITLGLNASDSTGDMTAEQVDKALSNRRFNFFQSQDGLDYLAARTGGIAIKNNNDLFGGIKKVLTDQEGYYLIGYRPDDSTFNEVRGGAQFHKIGLKIKRPGKFTVRMRNGFYGVSDESLEKVAQTPHAQIVNALTSPFGASGVQLRLTSLFVNDPKIGSAMHSLLHVNARDLEFKEGPDGRKDAVVDVLIIAFGDNGQVVEQFNYSQNLNIKKENFDRLIKNGFTYNVTVPIKKPGAYQLRTALRDRASGKVGSASQFIEVPDIRKNKLLLSGIVMKGMTLETYLKGNRSSNDGDTSEIETEVIPNAGSSVRQFRNGMALAYGFTIYNAQIDKTTNKTKLKMQMRVFRNGELFFEGNETPFDPSGQTDLKRLTANAGIQLGANMTPGEYVLQVVVTDMAKEKPRIASQWLDFEIVK